MKQNLTKEKNSERPGSRKCSAGPGSRRSCHRLWLLLMLLAVSLMLFSACGKNKPDTQSTTAKPDTEQGSTDQSDSKEGGSEQGSKDQPDTDLDDPDQTGSEDREDEFWEPVSLETESWDAESYYEDNSQVLSVVKAGDSKEVRSEKQASQELAQRGFDSYPVSSYYSMDGEFGETEISGESSEKHPSYETLYLSEAGEVWAIYVIDGKIMANPATFNSESGLNVQLILSETASVVSYDNVTNKFYETIPDPAALIVKTVASIDAMTLDNITIDVLKEEYK